MLRGVTAVKETMGLPLFGCRPRDRGKIYVFFIKYKCTRVKPPAPNINSKRNTSRKNNTNSADNFNNSSTMILKTISQKKGKELK